jgi:outer membrane lipoprotein-sorting protein
MKKYISLILICTGTLMASAQNGDSAKKLLDEVSDQMNAYQNVYVEFDYKLENKAENVTQDAKGDATLQGDKYLVHFFGTTQIFDGTKTYTIIPENEEVNISVADMDNQNTITPAKFYSFYKTGYTFDMGESKNVGGKNIQFVKLTPMDSNSEISSVIVGIDTKTKNIDTIKQIGENGTETVLKVKNLKTNQTLKSNLFSFDLKKYEDLGYIINE